MDFKNLIPWNRDRSVPVVRQREEDRPVAALHRDMNRVVADFFSQFRSAYPLRVTVWQLVWQLFRLAEYRARRKR
jgi:hypothetical protein